MICGTAKSIDRDAQDTSFVYRWRQEQEEALRADKGTGMTDDQVKRFVDGCKS